MTRSKAILLMLAVIIGISCSGKKSETPTQPSPSVAVSPPVMAPVPGPSPGPSVQATVPVNIQDRLRRPLTDQEIMQLPPATRDMILKAQGKPIPTPTKKK